MFTTLGMTFSTARTVSSRRISVFASPVADQRRRTRATQFLERFIRCRYPRHRKDSLCERKSGRILKPFRAGSLQTGTLTLRPLMIATVHLSPFLEPIPTLHISHEVLVSSPLSHCAFLRP